MDLLLKVDLRVYTVSTVTYLWLDVSNTNVMTSVTNMTMKSFLVCLKASQRSEKLMRPLIDTVITAASAACYRLVSE